MVPTGGISGAILVVKGLTRRGVPTNVAMAVLLVGLVAYFAAYLASVLASLAILWLHDRANATLFVVVAIFVAVVVAIPSGVNLLQAHEQWAKRPADGSEPICLPKGRGRRIILLSRGRGRRCWAIQWAISTGTAASTSICCVNPPKTHSLSRLWP